MATEDKNSQNFLQKKVANIPNIRNDENGTILLSLLLEHQKDLKRLYHLYVTAWQGQSRGGGRGGAGEGDSGRDVPIATGPAE